LGERDAGSVEARGSSPLTSTIVSKFELKTRLDSGFSAFPSLDDIRVPVSSVALGANLAILVSRCGSPGSSRESLVEQPPDDVSRRGICSVADRVP
jgi:hypothetical protein